MATHHGPRSHVIQSSKRTKLGDLAAHRPAAQQAVQVGAKGDDPGGGGLGRQQLCRRPPARQGR